MLSVQGTMLGSSMLHFGGSTRPRHPLPCALQTSGERAAAAAGGGGGGPAAAGCRPLGVPC